MSNSVSIRRERIINAPVGQQLFSLTIPMLYAVFAITSLGIADSFFISRLGTNELAAIGFIAPITLIIQNIALALGMSISSRTSALIGSNDLSKANYIVTHGFYLTAFTSVILVTVLYWQSNTIFTLLGAQSDTQYFIQQYMSIWIIAVPFLLCSTIFSSALRAIGDIKTSAIISISLSLINIILDPIFIFGFGPIPAMGMQGAALATVLALLFSCSLGFHKLYLTEKILSFIILSQEKTKKIISDLLRIAIPAMCANMLIPIGVAVITKVISTFGTQAIAGYGVGARIESILFFVVYALSATLPSFIGQNLGANKKNRVYQACKLSFIFVVLFYIFAYGLIYVLAQPIAAIFSDEPDVQYVTQWFIWIVPVTYGINAIIILINVCVNVLGKPQLAVFINSFRLLALYIPLALLGAYFYAFKGVFIGIAISNCLTGILAYRLLKNRFKTLNITRFDDTVASHHRN